ncbi:MAG: DNA polymerase IV [Longimicrobiales bacterium]
MTRTPHTEASTPSGPHPRILLVDCDAFYVQVARLEDPEGVGKTRLLLVGGSATGRGVVTSASYAAREYGVRSAMPTAQALRLCPEATVVPVPREACVRRSQDVREVLERLSPVVQAASIDEFYLDLQGTERLFADESLEDTAERIRQTVLEKTRISVSIGGSTRRMIAKLAAGLAKPGGVHVVTPGQEAEFMCKLDLAHIPGIGPAMVASLERRGLVTVSDALGVQERWLQKWLGDQRGTWLHQRIRGIDPTPVRTHEPRKSISSERTFSRDIDDGEELERQLMKLVVSIGGTLRKKSLRARTITVKIRDGDFTTRSAAYTLPDAIETDRAIVSVARSLFGELRSARSSKTRLLGVGLSNLIDRDVPSQIELFTDDVALEGERDRALSRVMDDLRHRFGDQAVRPGGVLRS